MAQPTTTDERDGDFASISTLIRRHQDYWTNKANERAETETARRYYDGDQLTPEQLQVLKERGQPAVVYNEIQPQIDGIVGTVERLRQDPRAYPRTPGHEDGAEVATNVLRYAMDRVQWQFLTPRVARAACIDAVAGVEMSFVEGDNGDPDIALKTIDAETFFYDPRSVEQDFSDARYMGVSKWVDIDVAKSMFPDHAEALEAIATQGFGQEEWNLNQRQNLWVITNERKIRLVEHWYIRGGEWKYAFYTGNLLLDEGVSPFYDERGRTISRYIVFSAHVDWEGDRYGFVRNLKPIQDEINSRRSLGLHALNTKRVYIAAGSVEDEQKIAEEINKPTGIIVLPPNAEVKEASNVEQAAGNLEMLQEAKQQMDRRGMSPPVAVDGGAPKDLSGRAIQLLQQAALGKIGPFLIAFRDWKMRVYRAVWNNIQRYWTSERWIRVTDADGLADFLPVNRIDVSSGVPQLVNPLGSLDVDIIIDEGPDTITLMQDVFDTLVALADRGVPVPPEVVLEMSNLPGSMKQKILGILQEASQKPNPEMLMQQARMEMEKAKADMDMQAKAATIQLEREKSAIEVERSRLKAAADIELAREKAAADMQIEREKAANQMEIERLKAEASMALQAARALRPASQPAS